MSESLFQTNSTMEDRFGKCPYATAQSLISGKWAILILHYLESGLVKRTQYESIPPKVEYSLTEMGEKFRPVIDALQKWGQEYIEYMKQEQYCKIHKKAGFPSLLIIPISAMPLSSYPLSAVLIQKLQYLTKFLSFSEDKYFCQGYPASY